MRGSSHIMRQSMAMLMTITITDDEGSSITVQSGGKAKPPKV